MADAAKGEIEYADPANHEAMFQLAADMHDVLSAAALAGHRAADLASAISMLAGLFLGGFDAESDRALALKGITTNALAYAEQYRALYRAIDLSAGGSA